MKLNPQTFLQQEGKAACKRVCRISAGGILNPHTRPGMNPMYESASAHAHASSSRGLLLHFSQCKYIYDQMDWFSGLQKGLQVAQEAALDAAEKAKVLASQASVQAKAYAEQAKVYAEQASDQAKVFEIWGGFSPPEGTLTFGLITW